MRVWGIVANARLLFTYNWEVGFPITFDLLKLIAKMYETKNILNILTIDHWVLLEQSGLHLKQISDQQWLLKQWNRDQMHIKMNVFEIKIKTNAE